MAGDKRGAKSADSRNKRPESVAVPASKTGVFVFTDTSRYEGSYKEIDGVGVVRHGQGKQISAGYTYTGGWDMDRMNGKGRLEYPSGAVFDGLWKDNEFLGEGTYQWADQSSLHGEWEGTRMTGFGKYTDSTGQGWIGAFYKGSASALTAEI
ncbi:hypothetical protein HDU76_009284 [Blyttiomyces sp. JEL0837]|nr:hypothetical protein HDU76_009284 [Blyttiomyces sp. JEL0837]